MKDFAKLNPIVSFIFYAGAVIMSMFFVHPAYLICSLVMAIAHSFCIKGSKAWKSAVGMIPLILAVAIINPVFNTHGETVIFSYFGGRPYTLEALFYGIALGLMFAAVIVWFSSFSIVMSEDKLMYMFGKRAPSLTMVLTMVFRMVPELRARAGQIREARRAAEIQEYAKTRESMCVASVLLDQALEGGLVTSDSMKSRGYGTGRRTAFAIYRFEIKDVIVMALLVLLMACVLYCALNGGAGADYSHSVEIARVMNPFFVPGFGAYIAYMAIPAVMSVVEEVTWRILRSGI